MKVAFDSEVKLWVYIKSLLSDENQDKAMSKTVFEYLNGFYQSLYHSIKLAWNQENHKGMGEKRDDEGHYRLDHHLFFSHPINLALKSRMHLKKFFGNIHEEDNEKYYRLLIYNILIRLGDLNRYLKFPEVSIGYYSQARDVNPVRGHAFNQLALMSDKDRDPSQQVYYYIRALCCLEDPVMISAHNIQSSVNRLIHLKETSDQPELMRGRNVVFLFQKNDDLEGETEVDANDVMNWIHTLIIGIFNRKTGMIIRPLLGASITLLRELIEIPPSDPKKTLEALDVLLEYTLHPEFAEQNAQFLKENERILSILLQVIDAMSGKDSSVSPDETLKTALPHDYSLVGFKHLKDIHSKYSWADTPDVVMNTSDKFVSLLQRIQSNARKAMAVAVTRNPFGNFPTGSDCYSFPCLAAALPISGPLVDLTPLPVIQRPMIKLVSDGHVILKPSLSQNQAEKNVDPKPNLDLEYFSPLNSTQDVLPQTFNTTIKSLDHGFLAETLDSFGQNETKAEKPSTSKPIKKGRNRNMVLQSMLDEG